MIIKVKSLSKVKRETWAIFSLYIRLRDCLKTTGTLEYGLCFTCGARLPFSRLQAGHFIPGRHSANLFSERGTNAQCPQCNVYLHGNPLEYRRKIIKLYGEEVDERLEKEAKQIKKFSIPELEGIKLEYKKKIELLRENA